MRLSNVSQASLAALPLELPVSPPRVQLRTIRELREWFGFSPDEFAKVIGVHRATVYRWENRGERPSPRTAEGRALRALATLRALMLRLWDDHTAHDWLSIRLPGFGHRTPKDTIIEDGPHTVLQVLQAHSAGHYT